MTTSNDPEVIRRQIEQTRRELSYDVDALNEKVNPARVMDRRGTPGQGRLPPGHEKGEGCGPENTPTAPYPPQNSQGSVQGADSHAPGPTPGGASHAAPS